MNLINGSIIERNQLHKVSIEFKKKDTNKKITHVLDRGFDDNQLFCFIDKNLKMIL